MTAKYKYGDPKEGIISDPCIHDGCYRPMKGIIHMDRFMDAATLFRNWDTGEFDIPHHNWSGLEGITYYD